MKVVLIVMMLSLDLTLTQRHEADSSKIVTMNIVNYEYPNLSHKEEVHYDSRGNKIKEVVYSSDGTLREEIVCLFNDLNQIVERNHKSSGSSISTKTVFRYGALNDSIPCEIRKSNSNGTIVFVVKTMFNKEGKPTVEKWYYSSDTSKVNSYTEFFYNETGLKKEELFYLYGELDIHKTYGYDYLNRLVYIRESSGPSYTKVIDIEYNDMLKTQSTYLISGKKKIKVSRELFNERDNLTNRTIYSEDEGAIYLEQDIRYVFNLDGSVSSIEEWGYKKSNILFLHISLKENYISAISEEMGKENIFRLGKFGGICV